MSTHEEETLITLMDSYWFEHGVFSPKPIINKAPIPQQLDNPKQLNRVATQMRKSHSDQFLSDKDCSPDNEDSSPKSVLTPQLQTILSGKESEDFTDSVKSESSDRERRNSIHLKKKKKKRKSSSKSLSELEFEELKGFMDLGFVFSDEDKDSKLVSIIPGLQRLGKEEESEMLVSRPYLSEAWDSFEQERKRNVKKNSLLMDLRIPEFGNEMELKNHLRFWAHSVASAVR